MIFIINSDLAANKEIRVGVVPTGATEARYKYSKSDMDMKIYEKILKDRQYQNESGSIPSNVAELENHLRQMTYSDYALILESTTAKFIANKDPCDLYMISGGIITSHQAFAMGKNSELKEPLDLALMKLQQSGALAALEEEWFGSKCKKSIYQPDEREYSDTPVFHPLDLGTFSSALLIIVAGIVLGGLISIIEICIYKWAETVSM